MEELGYSVGVRLRPDVRHGLKRAAVEERRKLSPLIAMICEEWLERRNNPQPETGPQAVASVVGIASVPDDGGPQPVIDWISPKPKPKRKR